MAGMGSNEIGKVSIGVEATGAEVAVQKLQDVENKGKAVAAEMLALDSQAASSTKRINDAYNTSISGPGIASAFNTFDDPHRVSKGRGGFGGAAKDIGGAAAATARLQDSMEGASKSAGGFLERARAFSAPIHAAISTISRFVGYLALAQAAYSTISYLQEKANEGLKKHVEAEKQLKELLDRRKVILEQVIEDEADKKRAELEESHKKEIEDTKARSGNAVWLDLRLAELKKQHAEELVRFDERISEASGRKKREAEVSNYESVLKETEAAESAARMEGMTEAQRIQETLAQKREEINRRISATTDQYTIDLLNRQLKAAETVAKKQDEALQEKQAKERQALEERARQEQERIKESADAIATAFNEAVGSAITQNQERIAQMFDSTALLQRFDGIASALEVLGRQRGIR
ncbi:MAG: hypothetical protein KGR25_00190 [Chloroflexi bacterium]|nr:hypothetical protein [Chloroflexota bacterium]